MSRRVVRVAMNGVTGRMGYRQHLVRSILAIREQGGVDLADGTVVDARADTGRPQRGAAAGDRRRSTASSGGRRTSPTCSTTTSVEVYFDAQLTTAREKSLHEAIAAGKHVYTEKPTAATFEGALDLARAARDAGIVHGVVQDKLFLPGMIKLRRLVDAGFFGRVLSVRLEFGYWVFEGDGVPAQRPSWNYRKAGRRRDRARHVPALAVPAGEPVRARSRRFYARQAIHLPVRWDETGKRYDVTADDSCYALLEFASGVMASVNSSWAVRVNRRELLELHVDGTDGSAVAGLRQCAVQHKVTTPMPVWNPDLPDPIDYPSQWADVPDTHGVRQRVQGAVGVVPPPRRHAASPFPGICSRVPRACSSPSSPSVVGGGTPARRPAARG